MCRIQTVTPGGTSVHHIYSGGGGEGGLPIGCSHNCNYIYNLPSRSLIIYQGTHLCTWMKRGKVDYVPCPRDIMVWIWPGLNPPILTTRGHCLLIWPRSFTLSWHYSQGWRKGKAHESRNSLLKSKISATGYKKLNQTIHKYTNYRQQSGHYNSIKRFLPHF